MDVSALTDIESSFDEIDWMNSIFKEVGKNDKEVKIFSPRNQIFQYLQLQSAVEDAITKLQLYVQKSNASIESLTHNIISSMPSVKNLSKKTLEEAGELKIKMNLLEKDISKSETAFSMANLERLDDLKTKLEAAKNFLEQSDR